MEILFVDDETAILEQAKIFLEKERKELSVQTVTSPGKGLDLLEKNAFDAVVSDYQMPERDGLEFLKVVREERDSNIPFIIFTGKGREEVAMEALNLGADRYLRKGGSSKSQYSVLAEAIVHEIKHKQVEERLELTNYSLENVDVGALWISPNGKIKYSNKKICQNLGYDKNEITDMTISDIDPNYPEERPEIWEDIKKSGKKVFRSEHGTKEGKTIPVRITSHYLERNGEEYEFAFVRDITEEKRREEELKEKTKMLEGMLDGVQDVIGFQKPDHTVIRYNQAGYDLLDTSPEEVKGKKCYELIGRDEECKKCATRKALKSKNTETVEKYQPELDKYLRATSNPVLNENGEVSFIIEQLQNITDRKEAEEEIKYRKDLERIITEVSTSLMNAEIEEIDDRIDEALERIGEFADADRSYVFQFYDDLEKMDNRHEWCAEGVEPQKDNLQDMSSDTYPWWMEKLKNFENIPIPKVSDLPPEAEAEKETLKAQNIKSLIVLPTISNNSLKGFIGFDWVRKEEEWSEEIIKLLRIAGETIASALDRKEMKEKYRIITEGSSNGIYVFQDGEFKFVNEAMVKLLGYSREELRDMNFLELIHPDYREDIVRWTDQALEGDTSGLPKKHEFEVLRKDGESVWVQITPSLIEYEGQPAIVGNVGEITERKRKEKELKSTLARLKTLMETQEVGILFENDEREVLYANQKFCELFEIPEPEAIIGSDCAEASKQAKEMFAEPEKFVQRTEELLEKTEPVKGDELELKDGRTFLRDYIPVYSEKGYIGHLWQYQDITERRKMEKNMRESEERYRRLFETAQDGMIILDAKTGEIKDANPYIQDLTGFSKEELVGRGLWEIGTFEDVVENKRRFDEIVDEGFIRYEDLPIKTKKGKEKMVEFVSNTYQAGGEIVVQCNIRDVSQRKEAEEREEFLHSLLRHDVRNKSQIVQGYLELMEDHDLPKEVKDYISKARKATRDGIDIIEKVRTLRDLGKENETREISIGPILKNVISESKPQTSEKVISIKCQADDCKIRGGPLLEELFSNLIENSIQHSRGNKIKISSKEKESECIVIVEDDGQGIPDEDKDKIFERGFKSGDTGGSGLGMYLVKQIIESYNTSIEVKDSELGGTRFDVRLEKA